MPNTTSKMKNKRLPKGKRAHVRKLKEEARRSGTVYKQPVNL